MSKQGLTYAESGVDIDKEDKAIGSLVSTLAFRRQGMGALFDLPGQFTGGVEFGEYVLSLCTDGVGSKILIADALGKWDTVGIDCMAMNVNDMICIGAEPIAFVDYIAIHGPDPAKMEQLGIGLNRAAELANVSIVGGETATLPEIVNGFDLAGTCLGVVKKDRIITGKDVRPGDAIIGLASSGVHSNGFSLIRKAVEMGGVSYTDPFSDGVFDGVSDNALGSVSDHILNDTSDGSTNRKRSLGEVLLEPTRIYVREIVPLFEEYHIHGMAHITGGGLKNIARINPDLGYIISDPLPVPHIFEVIRSLGSVEEYEMYRTFNMGMGFVIIAPEKEARSIVETLGAEVEAKIVGGVEAGKGVEFKGMKL